MEPSSALPLVVGGNDSYASGTRDSENGDESALCLVSKLLSDKPLNKTGIWGAIYRSWHFVLALEMEEVEGDRFIFSFQSHVCKNRVLTQVPWNIRGFPLILKPWKSGETLSEVDLSFFPLWVQIHGLPIGQTTRAMAFEVASKVGNVLEVDFQSPKGLWVTQFIKVKVMVEVDRPLCPGFFLLRLNRDVAWIQFKFEHIFGFCFNCGRLGHLMNICPAAPNSLVEPASFSYRTMANTQNYRRFSGPNNMIPKTKSHPAVPHPPPHSQESESQFPKSHSFQKEVTSMRRGGQAGSTPLIGDASLR